MKVDPEASMFRMSLTCDVTIMSAAADVNPEDTGPDIKSMMNP